MAQIKYYTGGTKAILEQNIRAGATGYNNKDIILYSDSDNDYIYVVNSDPRNISYLSLNKNTHGTQLYTLYNNAFGDNNRISYWETPNGNKQYLNKDYTVNINEAFNNVTSNNGVDVSNFSKWLQGNHSPNAHVHNFSYTAYWNGNNAGYVSPINGATGSTGGTGACGACGGSGACSSTSAQGSCGAQGINGI